MTATRHLFVIDPLEKLNLKLDSSLRMANALLQSGHECFSCEINSFQIGYFNNELSSTVQARPIKDTEWGKFGADNFGEQESYSLSHFDAVHMRKDPPFDMNYVATTWFLDEAAKSARVYNHPEALRKWNEKLIILRYPEYIDPVLVSSNHRDIMHFIKSLENQDAIVKPLDLFGGRGVYRLNLNMEPSFEAASRKVFDDCQDHSIRLVQPFNHRISEGEVRVFCAGGKVIATCLKKPQPDSFLANTRAGASLEDYTLSPDEHYMVTEVSKDLMQEGIFFTGFDLIGGKISEINITSPRLLVAGEPDRPYYERIVAMIEQDLKETL